MDSVPFSLPDLHGGLTEIEGSLYLDDEFLVIDLLSAFMGEFNKEVQTIKVEPAALADAHLDTGLVRDRLCIRPKKPALLETVPGKHAGEVRFKVWRKHRVKSKSLVRTLRLRMGLDW